MYFLIFDTETTGFRAKNRLVQLAWQLYKNEDLKTEKCFVVKPNNFTIPRQVVEIHGISTEIALEKGKPLKFVLKKFLNDLNFADYIVGHNLNYDIMVLDKEFSRLGITNTLMAKKKVDTMFVSTDFVKLPPVKNFTKYKYPKLKELYYFLFNKEMKNAHNALADVKATAQCFFELKKQGIIEI